MSRPRPPLFLRYLCISFAAASAQPAAIAVTELSAEGIEVSEARLIGDRLRNELLNTGAFRVLERGEMERILAEQGFQQSGACDEHTCAVEIGQILGVTHMLTGSVGRISEVISVNVRMIAVATGEIVYSISTDCRCRLSDVLVNSTREIATRAAAHHADYLSGIRQSSTLSTSRARKPLLRRAGFWVPAGLALAGGATAALIVLTRTPGAHGDESIPTTGGIEFTW